MLLLFDIDQTLLNTGGAGIRALHDAFEEAFEIDRNEHPELNLAGATDLGILREFKSAHRITWDDALAERFFEISLRNLDEGLAKRTDGLVLPGIIDLLNATPADSSFTIGLLTGNLRLGAETKIRHFGLSKYFNIELGAYGCDHWDRNELGPIALNRVATITGKKFTAEQTVVIGDTPKDINCAKSFGARCLAVGTGMFTAEQLQAHGADHSLETLTDTAAILEWITTPCAGNEISR